MKRVDLIFVQITSDCNANCVYCPFSYENKIFERSIDLSRQDEVLREVLSSKLFTSDSFRSLVLYGGEPLLYENQIKKIVREYRSFRDNGEITLCTNGFLLNREMISYCRENSIGVAVNMDGDRELVGTLKKITTSEWDNLIASVQYLHNQGVSCDFSTTVTPQFLSDFANQIAFLESLQPRMIGFNFLRDKISQAKFQIVDPVAYFKDAMSRVFAYNSRFNFNRTKKLECFVTHKQTSDCICAGLGITILADGSLTTCGIFPSQKCSSIVTFLEMVDENIERTHSFQAVEILELATFGGGCAKLSEEDNKRYAYFNALMSYKQFVNEKL